MGQYTVGIDFGTLSGRCLIADVKTGEEMASAAYEYPHKVISGEMPNGLQLGADWNLQHPQDYLDVLSHTVREAMGKAEIKPEEIIGIGIDCTGCTMLPVKKNGLPVCFIEKYKDRPNAYVKLWKHHSTQSYADRMTKAALERNEKFIRRYGGKISSEWMFPKVWQTLCEDAEVYAETDAFLEAVDWIVMQLTGKMIRSSCPAGAKACWNKMDGFPSAEYFRACDKRLEHVIEEKFPGEIKPIGTRAGEMTQRGAELTGLLVGTPVAVGHFDAHGATVGAKVTRPGQMLIMMGTSSCHEVLCEKEIEVPGSCGYVEDGIVPGYFGYEAGQSSVGDSFAWFVENCLPGRYLEEAGRKKQDIYDYLNGLAGKKIPGETGLLALDWWNGNRSVLVDGELSGLLLGCTLQTKPEDIYRALIEATAFGTRKIMERFLQYGISIDEVIIAGGIAQKNPFIMQIYADVTGKEIQIAGSKQNAALSSCIWAALAAGSKNGGYDNVDEAAKVMGNLLDKRYIPDKRALARYDNLYKEYELLHDYFGNGGNNIMKRMKKETNFIMKERMQKC